VTTTRYIFTLRPVCCRSPPRELFASYMNTSGLLKCLFIVSGVSTPRSAHGDRTPGLASRSSRHVVTVDRGDNRFSVRPYTHPLSFSLSLRPAFSSCISSSLLWTKYQSSLKSVGHNYDSRTIRYLFEDLTYGWNLRRVYLIDRQLHLYYNGVYGNNSIYYDV